MAWSEMPITQVNVVCLGSLGDTNFEAHVDLMQQQVIAYTARGKLDIRTSTGNYINKQSKFKPHTAREAHGSQQDSDCLLLHAEKERV